MKKTVEELEAAVRDIKRDLLTLCSRKAIHIGGDLSSAEIMTVLWQYAMRYNPRDTLDETRDRFVLSKGHAAAVMSLNQAAIGCFGREEFFAEYAEDGGRFSMHSCKLVNPYVEVSTGSLGHGLPVACGIAEGLRRKGNRSSRIYTLMGDGEQCEGSVWEAAMLAAHLKLGNLVAAVDRNRVSADGSTDELTALGDVGEKYRAFGWNVVEVDGHSVPALVAALDSLPAPDSDIPTVLICHTVKGHGVSFMENDAAWHSGKLSPEQYSQAMREVLGEVA